MCVVCYSMVHPWGPGGWWPLYVAPLSHSFTSRSLACHTLPVDTHTGRHSHGAWHAVSLKRQETQMWQPINFVWPRSTQGSACTQLCCTSLAFRDTRRLWGVVSRRSRSFPLLGFGFQGFFWVFLASPGSLANRLNDEEEASFLPC